MKPRISRVWANKFGMYARVATRNGLDILIYGVNKYLNFGSQSGTSGYGFRDLNGVMQMKNAGGEWGDIPTSASSGGGTYETPVGLINDVNRTYSVSGQPKWVYYRGTTYFEGANGYSYSAPNIVMPFAPSNDGAAGGDISDQFKALI